MPRPSTPPAPASLVLLAVLASACGGGGGGKPDVVEPPAEDPTPALARSSPRAGEVGVGVERPIVLEFTEALDAATITADAIFASVRGEVLESAPIAEGDGERVHLFFSSVPMPAASAVRVTVDGDLLLTRQGEEVDGDADGEPGGVGHFEFTTVGLREVAGTEVTGRVVAAEPGPGGDDEALEGVVVSVDGLSEAAVTDADGHFTISDAPAGALFLKIDGGSAENADEGFEYAVLERTVGAKAGQSVDLGTIHLPAIASSGYRFPKEGPHVAPPEQLELWPAKGFAESLALLEAHVPAGTPFFEEDGSVGGKFAVAGSPAARPPGFLPTELGLPMVGIVQTNGRHRFQHLVGVTLPNLPAPGTQAAPKKGSVLGLWYYDPEVGCFELQGPMTVSNDGRTVATDEEVGLPGPGWFGASRAVQMVLRGEEAAEVACTNTVPGSNDDEGWNLYSAALACELDVPGLGAFEELSEARAGLGALADLLDDVAESLLGGDCGPSDDAAEALVSAPESFADAWSGFVQTDRIEPASAALRCAARVAADVVDALCDEPMCIGAGAAGLCEAAEGLVEAGAALGAAGETLDPGAVDAALAGLLDAAPGAAAALEDGCKGNLGEDEADELQVAVRAIETVLEDLLDAVDSAGAAADSVLFAEERWALLVGEALPGALAGSGGYARSPWRLVAGGVVRRGRTESGGSLSQPLPPETEYDLEIYVHRRRAIARAAGTTPASGNVGSFGPFELETLGAEAPDADGDGVPDVAEELAGTDPEALDTDGDGRLDGLELYLGHDPLTAYSFDDPIVASAETLGTALDVAVRGDLVAVAQGEDGIELFGAADRFDLLQLAALDTPGSASRVALDGRFAVVADGLEGLAVLDVRRPTRPEIVHQLAFGSPVNCVVADAGLAYAGLGNTSVVSVDLRTGGLLGQVSTDNPVLDLSLAGGHLYALTATRVHAIETRLGLLLSEGSHPTTTEAIANERLFAAGEDLFAVHSNGVSVFSIEDPATPGLEHVYTFLETGWRQLVPGGSNLAVGLVGATPASRAVRNYALFGSAQEPIWLQEQTVQTPGNPSAMGVESGLAFVADGTEGLQVVAPFGFDPDGVPPSIELVTEPAPGALEEGDVVRARAEVDDDLHVAAVEFLLNDQLVARDGSYPFEIGLIAPLVEEVPELRLRARAIDTGGIPVESEVGVFDLQPDTSPPSVLSALPVDGAELAIGTELTVLAVLFSEPMDLATLLDKGVEVLATGPDYQLGTEDDDGITPPSVHASGTLQSLFFVFADPLDPGHYRIRVAPKASDLSGNALGEEVVSDFTVLGTDSDGDGLFDFFELNVSGTDPFDADTDDDGLADGDELLVHGTLPDDPDFDDDGIYDGVEVAFGTSLFDPNAATRVRGVVESALDGTPVPGASVHVEDAKIVPGNPLVSFLTESIQDGTFAFPSAWPAGPHPIRIEVRSELQSTGQVSFGLSDYLVPVTEGNAVTEVGTIELHPVGGSRGLDFVGAFLPNIGGLDTQLELWIAASEDTSARVKVGGVDGPEETIEAIPAGTTEVLTYARVEELQLFQDGTFDGVQPRGFHVWLNGSAANVFARSSNVGKFPLSSDAFTVLPRHMLGVRHRIASYPAVDGGTPLVSQFAVVAAVNDTEVTITPSTDTELRAAGVPYTVELDRLEVYHLATLLGDLSGTLVVADKAVSAISGHQCAEVEGTGVPDCDLLAEQVPARRSTWEPVWGQDLHTVPLATREGGDLFRILADDQPTVVTIEGPSAPPDADGDGDPDPILLEPGEWTELVLDGLHTIHGSRPILVVQHATSSSFDAPTGTGGPFSMVLADRTRHLPRYAFHVPNDLAIDRHFVNVVIRDDQIEVEDENGMPVIEDLKDLLRLDGGPIPPETVELDFEPIPGSKLLGAQIEVQPGPHVLEVEAPPGAIVPFGLSVYGFGEQVSYGYPGSL